MSSRSKAREILMQVVFQFQAQDSIDERLLSPVCDEHTISHAGREYIEENFAIISEHIDEIDRLIDDNASGWALSRISKTDIAIMRVAIGESVFGNTPKSVAINEAVELAKKYSGEKSPGFVNAVLGKAI